MSSYFSKDKSGDLYYLFEGNLSKSKVDIGELLNTLADMTSSKYYYTQKYAPNQRKGEVLAIYNIDHFLKKGPIIVQAKTSANSKMDYGYGEAKVNHVHLTHSEGCLNRDLYNRIYEYLSLLEKGEKA